MPTWTRKFEKRRIKLSFIRNFLIRNRKIKIKSGRNVYRTWIREVKKGIWKINFYFKRINKRTFFYSSKPIVFNFFKYVYNLIKEWDFIAKK